MNINKFAVTVGLVISLVQCTKSSESRVLAPDRPSDSPMVGYWQALEASGQREPSLVSVQKFGYRFETKYTREPLRYFSLTVKRESGEARAALGEGGVILFKKRLSIHGPELTVKWNDQRKDDWFVWSPTLHEARSIFGQKAGDEALAFINAAADGAQDPLVSRLNHELQEIKKRFDLASQPILTREPAAQGKETYRGISGKSGHECTVTVLRDRDGKIMQINAATSGVPWTSRLTVALAFNVIPVPYMSSGCSAISFDQQIVEPNQENRVAVFGRSSMGLMALFANRRSVQESDVGKPLGITAKDLSFSSSVGGFSRFVCAKTRFEICENKARLSTVRASGFAAVLPFLGVSFFDGKDFECRDLILD